jgi:hypothetical protein
VVRAVKVVMLVWESKHPQIVLLAIPILSLTSMTTMTKADMAPIFPGQGLKVAL